jgi:hypothetical protein
MSEQADEDIPANTGLYILVITAIAVLILWFLSLVWA